MTDEPPDPRPAISAVASRDAPLGRRVFAKLVDLVAIAVVAVPVLTITARDDHAGGVRFPLVVLIAYAALPALYEAHQLVRFGATPGKRLSGLLVTTNQGTSITPLAAGIRSVTGWTIPAVAAMLLARPTVLGVIVVTFVSAAIPRWHRDLPDLFARTRVCFVGDITDEAHTHQVR